MKEILLHDGTRIPQIGLGTWQITDRNVMKNVISDAYHLGYRLIDTAAAYSNEISIAKAIEINGIKREDIILSDKVWNTSRGYRESQDACKKSLKKLKTDFFDIYLIHWPASKRLYPEWAELNADTWRGLERLYKDGWVKAVGVCNFKIHHLKELMKMTDIVPFINQIECHPGFPQEQLISFCKKNNIVVEAGSPLGNGQILRNNKLINLGEKYHKSSAQICIRWLVQKGLVALPKSVKRERLRENIDVFDFELSDEDMRAVDSIPYCGGIGIDSDEVTEFG